MSSISRSSNKKSQSLENEQRCNRVLVTGGAGYIGSVLSRMLIDHGYFVRILDNFSLDNFHLQCLWQSESVEVCKADIRDPLGCNEATKNVDTVVHLAGIVGDPACELDRQLATDINIGGTRNILSACLNNGVKQIIFASSCSVYGAATGIVDEESRTNPLSLYAQTKLESEIDLLRSNTKNLAVTVLRFSTVFGYSPRQRFDLVANAFIAQALLEKYIELHGGNQHRPFVHVVDVAILITKLLSLPPELISGQVFNVGSSHSVLTIAQLAILVKEIAISLGISPSIVKSTVTEDKRDYAVSFSKIERELKFFASNSIRDGIGELGILINRGFFNNFRHPIYSNVKLLKRQLVESTFSSRQLEMHP